jgi:Phage Tail Collar Domain
MSYRITLSNGDLLFNLADGLVDTSKTSISLVGKNAVNFGQAQNNDFVHMLENFAYAAAPQHPLIGQLWFDTSTDSLKVYNNESNWVSLAATAFSSSAPSTASQGQMWFNTSTNQLSVGNGTSFKLIGPEMAPGFLTSRMVSASIRDISGNYHPVIKCVLNNEVIALISGDDFDILYVDGIPGISHANRGITFKSGVVLNGTATSGSNADALKSDLGNVYVSASTSTSYGTIVQRDNVGNINANKLTVSTLESSSGLLKGNWKVDSDFTPTANIGANLGSVEIHWNHVYSDYVDTKTVNASTVIATTGTFGTTSFTGLKDRNNISVTAFDIDSTLSASSDSRLSTQKAIKTYVDAAVANALTKISSNNDTLQSQISALGLPIPPGTVMYFAGSTPPAGYLIANGAAVSKDTYYKLFLALGGTSSPYGQTSQLFYLPNLNGQFIRSLDNGQGVDPGRTIGSPQDESFKSHYHVMPGDDQLGFAAGYSGWQGTSEFQFPYDARSVYGGGGQMWRTTNSGGSETRPKNIALLAIIKY